MHSTQNRAQGESQPVPYWPGEENAWKAFQDGIVTESSDFDKNGVLAMKPKALRASASAPRLLPFQKQRRPEIRVPLGRLDKATSTAPAAVMRDKATSTPLPAPTRNKATMTPPMRNPNVDLAVLRREMQVLDYANAALARKVAAQAKQIHLQDRVICSAIDYINARS